MFLDLLSTPEAQKRFRGKQPQAELKKGCAYKKKRVPEIILFFFYIYNT